MDFTAHTGAIEKKRISCLIAGVYEKNKLTESAELINHLSEGMTLKILKQENFKGQPGDLLLLHQVPGCKADRLLLVGLGKKKDVNAKKYCKALSAAAKKVAESAVKQVLSTLVEVPVETHGTHWKARQTALLFQDACYRFTELKSEPGDLPNLDQVLVHCKSQEEAKSAARGMKEGKAIAEGMRLCKDLANLPGNVCTPGYLAETVLKLADEYSKLKVQILEETDMEKLGMGALLAVSKGSRRPAKLIVLEYKGGKAKDQPVALVGKGLTFDAGGISLKPSQAMDEMKYDMCGGASVLGTLKTIAQLDLPLNVVGVVPSSENLPDGDAIKPGDIVKTMAGKTVEILNTDAEGRLILCDALTYTERFNPKTVIDIATLTGACVVALGKHATGLFANDDSLAQALLEAGEASLDRAWRMPLWEEYQEQLKSNFADMPNIGDRNAGAITAACFLARFTENFHWAHLDIAGTAWHSGANKGATGRPVPLLSEYLISQVET